MTNSEQAQADKEISKLNEVETAKAIVKTIRVLERLMRHMDELDNRENAR